MLCGSFYLPSLFKQNKGGRGNNNLSEMKKLAPVWKVVIGLFQKDYHSRPVNKSYRKKQGTLVLFFWGGIEEEGVNGCPSIIWHPSWQHVPHPVVDKDPST